LGSNGEIIRFVGTIVDVTEQNNSVERLLHDALHDNLTGLPNRQVFLDRLQSVLALAPGGDTLRPTVMVIDIDQLVAVNV
ncbi:diguanylate cyclase domain-containing protein, partial [Rhizobium ruizarguesonis]